MVVGGRKFLTIHAVENGEYEINYGVPSRINILNNTDGDIHISVDNNFSNTETVAQFMILPSNVAANNIAIPSDKIYIKTTTGLGNIVIERCG